MISDRCKKCGKFVRAKEAFRLVEGGIEHVDCSQSETKTNPRQDGEA